MFNWVKKILGTTVAAPDLEAETVAPKAKPAYVVIRFKKDCFTTTPIKFLFYFRVPEFSYKSCIGSYP